MNHTNISICITFLFSILLPFLHSLSFLSNNTDIFKSIIEQGHTIGNHTFSHANSFGFFSTKKVVSELNETNSLVKKLTGKSLLLFRPAFGVTNPRIKRAVNQLNLQTVGWNKRSLDTTKLTEKQILGNVFHLTKERLSCQTKVLGDIHIDITAHIEQAPKKEAKIVRKTRTEVQEERVQRKAERDAKPPKEGGWYKPKPFKYSDED